MKKNGFTLIELVGAILIIAILALVAFPAITSILNSGQKEIDNDVKKLIISAATNYVNDHENEDITTITVCQLVQSGYISMTFYDKYHDDIYKGQVSVPIGDNSYIPDGNSSGCSSLDG